MTTRTPEPVSPELRPLLDEERPIPAQPAAVRARVMVRAQAALIARDERLFEPRRSAPRTRWAAAAALLFVTALAAGAAAYAIRARLAASPERKPVSLAPRTAAVPAEAAITPPPVVPAAAPAPVAEAVEEVTPALEPAVESPRLSRSDAMRAELRLLRRARAAVIRDDFAAALSPIAEHARRFKDGRLAEEREALRVKALAGLGRTAEAQRAADAFKTRFPRSVLSPAVSQMPSSRP